MLNGYPQHDVVIIIQVEFSYQKMRAKWIPPTRCCDVDFPIRKCKWIQQDSRVFEKIYDLFRYTRHNFMKKVGDVLSDH